MFDHVFLSPAVSSKGSSAGFSQVRDLLKREFNHSVELQVIILHSTSSLCLFDVTRQEMAHVWTLSLLPPQFLRTPSSFAFRVVSGPLIFTAVSVINTLRQAPRSFGPVPTVSPLFTIPDLRYQIHSVLQFVPAHVDVRVCNFSEKVEKGLTKAFEETQKRLHEAGNVTVQVSLFS